MTQLITQVVSETPNDARAIGGLSAAVGVSRATFYRHRQRVQPAEPSQAERQARQAIQEVALEMPSYGHRPMTAELQRRGHSVGRDRVLRYMREANLLWRRRRAFVATTDSRHGLKVFPNLARDLMVTNIDQLG
jgi:transposase InsO family protein